VVTANRDHVLDMRWFGHRVWSRIVAATALVGSGCNCRAEAAEDVPDEGPMPELRTGELLPETQRAITGRIVARHVEPGPGALAGTFVALELDGSPSAFRSRVVIDDHPAAIGVLGDRLLVRFPNAPGKTIRGRIFVDDDGWKEVPFSAEPARTVASSAELVAEWSGAFADALAQAATQAGGAHPWHAFARARVRALGDDTTPFPERIQRGPVRRSDLGRLMATTTGMVSLQEGLQHDRGLLVRSQAGERTIAIAELEPPSLARHAWPDMQARLPEAEAPEEPLAAAAPADFWYFRFDTPATLGVCLHEAEQWLIPARRLADEEAHAYDVVDRYRAQLGLEWNSADVVRTSVVSAGIALVGSDPYLREGSDVTAIFRTATPDALHDALDETRTRDHVDLTHGSSSHRGHAIDIHEHASGLRQHVATTGDYVVVSNSPGAMRAVLDAIDGARDRLADEPDFAYMRARDPAPHDAYFFAGDRFVARVIGPEQKVLEARRQVALSELLVPGYAALLHGWLRGTRPDSVRALIDTGLLDRAELLHDGGEPIAFTLRAGASSSWGRPSFMTPLIDLPAVTTVSVEEKEAYADFVAGYKDYWSQTIDPFAAGLDLEREVEGQRLVFSARVLPLVENTTYDDLQEVVGDARITVPENMPGLRATWAVGADTRVRRQIDSFAAGLGRSGLGIGWLGGWVEVGVLDRRALAVLVAGLDEDIQLPKRGPRGGMEEFAALAKMPIYVAAEVQNEAALATTLVAARAAANAAAPGMIEWNEHSKYRGSAVVEIRGPKVGEDTPAAYYAIADGVFVLALGLDTLHAAIDRVLDERAPTTTPGDTQFVLDVEAGEGHGLSTSLAWLLHGQALGSQHAALLDAEALLRGMPGLASSGAFTDAAIRTFGAVPIDAAGSSHFDMADIGAVSEQLGSEVRPYYPALPIEGSPAKAMVDHLRAFRAEVAFEPEPGDAGKSLKIRVELHTR
jgi:hypothetical protein